MKVIADSQLAVLPKPGSKQQRPEEAYRPRTSRKRPPAASVRSGSDNVSPPGSVTVAVAGSPEPPIAAAVLTSLLIHGPMLSENPVRLFCHC